MAYTTINKSTDYFDTRTYSASGAGSISDLNFQPDFIWFRNRTAVGDSGLFDAIRGVTKYLISSSNSAGLTGNGSNDFTAFTSNGFNYGASSQLDTGSGTPVTWCWKANGTGSSNTVGSINSTVSANTTSGFSVVTFTGTGANATVGHGLGSVPKMIILKSYGGSTNWIVYHNSIGNGKALSLNTTAAESADAGYFNSTTPTSTVFSLGSDGFSNGSGQTMVAYCFADKKGFSKFGSYVGNGNADGPFIYTGFRPAFILTKNTSGTNNWTMCDNKRNTFNPTDKVLNPNVNTVEATNNPQDFLSNGFKNRATESNTNASGSTYIYMAFAEAPLVGTNNVPANAR